MGFGVGLSWLFVELSWVVTNGVRVSYTRMKNLWLL